jgi:hypothetical protein
VDKLLIFDGFIVMMLIRIFLTIWTDWLQVGFDI